MSKGQMIDDLLANDFYEPDSGLMRRLRFRLMKLAEDDVSDLKTVVELKIAAARNEAIVKAQP